MSHSALTRGTFLAGIAATAAAMAISRGRARGETTADAHWKKVLTPEQYYVLRQNGTEAPFSSPLNNEHRSGTYFCVACNLALFSSRTKFDAGEGWPSFWRPLPNALKRRADYELADERTEVHCARCAGHLGHVFDDGPKPTGLRYCIDGVALRFAPGHAPPA